MLIAVFLFAAPVHGSVTADNVTFHSQTMTFRDEVPCTGVTSTITITFNGVMHMNADSSGGQHFTFTQTGDFSAVGDNGIAYTGHFTIWGGGNFQAAGNGGFVLTMTFSGHGTGSDGSVFHWNSVSHMTVNSLGTLPVVLFQKMRCH